MMNTQIQQPIHCYIKLVSKLDADLNCEGLADGCVFAGMLGHAAGFRFGFGEIQIAPNNWIHKLSNIKAIVKKVSQYFQYKLFKGIRTNDINVIQIAKNNNKQQLLKLFEIVVATLTSAPNSQQHISLLTNLPGPTQQYFITQIHKILQNRILPIQVYRQDKLYNQFHELQFQNAMLLKEIDSLIQNNTLLAQQLQQYRKYHESQSQLELESVQYEEDKKYCRLVRDNQCLRGKVWGLERQLRGSMQRNQLDRAKFMQEIQILNARVHNLSHIEQTLQIYKQKYSQMNVFAKDNRKWQKQVIKLKHNIAQKQGHIKKLQLKLDEAIEQNYGHQEKEVYLMMELQKKQVHFRQLQKQVKKLANDSTQCFSLPQQTLGSDCLSIDLTQKPSLISDQFLQNKELKSNLEELKRRNRQNGRQNNKLMRKIQKYESLEDQKKKLERMVVDAHLSRIQEISVLVTALDQMYQDSGKL